MRDWTSVQVANTADSNICIARTHRAKLVVFRICTGFADFGYEEMMLFVPFCPFFRFFITGGILVVIVVYD
jgi:hypothetical protein